MINYTSQYQSQFEDFSNLCQLELDPTNRWIQLGALLAWDRMVEVYVKRFSLTLFVELRKRLGEDTFDEFSRTLIALSEDLPSASGREEDPKSTPKGKLKIDATVADQYIRYPTDLSLVNEARIKTEGIIDLLWGQTGPVAVWRLLDPPDDQLGCLQRSL